jgi:phage tail protein X
MTVYAFDPEAGTPLAGDAIAPTPAAVRARLRMLGLSSEGLSIGCEGGRVTVEGPVADAATQERIVLAVGNLRGVARVVDRMVPAKRGGGLMGAFGGLAHLPRGAANLDAAEARVHEAAPDPGALAFGPGGSLFHTVQPGETLEGIAQRHYGMTREAWRIREANPGLVTAEGPEVAPGLVLRLPEAGSFARRHAPPLPSTR